MAEHGVVGEVRRRADLGPGGDVAAGTVGVVERERGQPSQTVPPVHLDQS